ncbi:hypothetical protein ACFLSK_02795 [Chloroflexota bacterium]
MRVKLLIGLLVLGVLLISIFLLSFGCIKTPSLVGPTPDCEPEPDKNKVAVIIAKDGIYDTVIMNSQISAYYEAVKKDLNIENVGLKKFDGETISELDNFVEELYLRENIAYIVLIGDDLPVANVTKDDSRNLHAIYEKLECINKERCFNECSNIAISYILPPMFYPDDDKADFVLKILGTYTDYHDNFATYDSKYQKSALYIKAKYPAGTEEPPEHVGYDLPKVIVFNTEHEKVKDELKSKHIILTYPCGAHGSPTSIGIGLSDYGIQTTLEEYSSFVEENGTPALFIDAATCGASVIKSDTSIYCCWPQIYMESGVWAYYSLGGGGSKIMGMQEAFSKEETIGLAIRKNIIDQALIFGDILAHIQ